MKVREEDQFQQEGVDEASPTVGVKRSFSAYAEGNSAADQSTAAATPAIEAAATAATAAGSGVDLSKATANGIHSGTNGVGEGGGGDGSDDDGGSNKNVKIDDGVAVVVGETVAAGAGAASVPNGAGAAAVPNGAMEPAEPLPNRFKPRDPSLQIHEVTNDGDAANMEMLIHVKASLIIRKL